MPARDPTHWLHRLAPEEWLAAAENELRRCEQAFGRRATRAGVTHARRAAGMALNAVLAIGERPAWGRSYMEHLVALRVDETAPGPVREAVARLVETRPFPPELVSIGKPDLHALADARAVVDWAQKAATAA